ncbi:MAG: cytochrome c biogenesis protein CcsA [Bacteroidetes bacterium]|nr:cytochrome c biogenesis protein CcsA [Bacteroidota bacterium]
MFGSILIWIASAAAFIAVFFYFISIKKKKLLPYARVSIAICAIGIITASALLMVYIFQHRFEYSYVTEYSSRDLPADLLATVFWAGQEGSLLLWVLFAAVIAFFLQNHLKRNGMESEAMALYSLVLAFLIMLITVKSPFEYIWQAYPELPAGFIPEDGRGLNPLLQNFWMIIHPPVLFLGFALLSVPFVLALAALIRIEHDEWIRIVRPWLLFGAAALGAGLILGGYWAYGVLGWGGWWGWDPVENSSLIPWMLSLILIHTLLIQKNTGRLVKTNFALAVLLYLLIMYSTFLTRSGILAEVSVHSFITSGSLTYLLLIMWMVLVAACAAGILFGSFRKRAAQTASGSLINRESLMSAAMIVLGLCAAIILFGTSRPIFSNSAVGPDFYNRTTFPFAVIMMLLLGLSLRAEWNQTDLRSFLKDLIVPAVFAVIVSAFLVLYGMKDISALLLTAGSIFAFFIIAEEGIRLLKKNRKFIGGMLAHGGLAILFIGIILSGRYGRTMSASLPLDQPRELFGYKMTYKGTSYTEDGKSVFTVAASRDGSFRTLEPVMFESIYYEGLMRNPDYISYWNEDLYIEPVSIKRKKNDSCLVVDLAKGEAAAYGSMTITFNKFDFSSYNKNEMIKGSGAEITIGVVLEVKTEKGSQIVVPATKFYSDGEKEMKTVYLKNSGIGFRFSAINIGTDIGEKTRIEISITGLKDSAAAGQNPETLVAEVSVKPFISLIWISALLVISGMLIAVTRHLRLNKA